jgi:hypothetical protein
MQFPSHMSPFFIAHLQQAAGQLPKALFETFPIRDLGFKGHRPFRYLFLQLLIRGS